MSLLDELKVTTTPKSTQVVEDIEMAGLEALVVYEDDEIDGATAMDVVEDAMSDLAAAQSGMESMLALAEGFQANGGMTRQTAEAVQLGLAIAARGYIHTPSLGGEGAGLESFDDAENLMVASAIGLESIKEGVKELWEKILKALASIRAKLVEYITTLFTSTGRLKAQLSKIKQAAEAAKSAGKSYDGEIELSGSEVGAISLKGSKDVSVDAVLNKLKASEDDYKYAGEIAEVLLKAIGKVEKLTDEDLKNANYMIDEAIKASEGDHEVGNILKGMGFTFKQGAIQEWVKDLDFGDKSVVVKLKGLNVSVSITSGSKHDSAKLKALTPDEVLNVVGSIEKLLKEQEAQKAEKDKLNSILKDYEDSVRQLLAHAYKIQVEGKPAQFVAELTGKYLAGKVINNVHAVSNLATVCHKEQLAAAKVLLNIAVKSLKGSSQAKSEDKNKEDK